MPRTCLINIEALRTNDDYSELLNPETNLRRLGPTPITRLYFTLQLTLLVLRSTQRKTRSFGESRLEESGVTLRRLSKFEPVLEKPDNIYEMRILNPWILSTYKASKLQ
ncbi:hypothetical protein PIB30_012252 [Stylosanthes scabra]|uniref:Uncharacterized protein n=1 Tax=Stylosanthes scabra TaxID=79078 RepID=A0ABU6W5P4_9FABA|nr:hypothetical protein [Stylosanthes scabra]